MAERIEEHVAILRDAMAARQDEAALGLDSAVDAFRERAEGAASRLETTRNEALRAYDRARERYEEVRQQLDALERGDSVLSRPTQHLRGVLAEAGIDARPVCELVECTDPRWQPALEAYLGPNTEALHVPPAQAREAVALYRRLDKRRAIYGATVINTEKAAQWSDPVEADSCAAPIQGEDPAAVNFLRRFLRGLVRMERDDRYFEESRSFLTPDGMLHRNAGHKRLALSERVMLGRSARYRRRRRSASPPSRPAASASPGGSRRPSACLGGCSTATA